MLPRTMTTRLMRLRGAVSIQPHRTATVLRRVNNPPLLGPYATQKQIDESVLRDNKYLRYQIVNEDDEADSANQPLRVILLKSMEDFGRRGQILSLPREKALKELILPKWAVYASPDNLEQYKDITIPEDSVQYSSDSIKKFLPNLSRMCFPVIMSQNHPWTLEPYHIRASMRRQGLQVDSVDCIEIPKEPIVGPNDSLETKEFPIWLKINEFEKVAIRCILFHWSAEEEQIEECPPPGWDVRFYKPMFESYSELLNFLPRPKLEPSAISHLKDKHQIVAKYQEWRNERDKKLFSN